MLTISPIADTPEAALERVLPSAPYLRRLHETGTRGHWRDALQAVRDIPADLPEAEAMTVMRKAKAQLHLSLAAEDLSGILPVMSVTRALSEFAEACLEAALRVTLARRGVDGAGIFAVALGKMGAYELNYSSDIDICVFYEPGVFMAGDYEAGETAQRIARDIVRIMQELTGDGYVFRTDLRLRPDPSSTPLAVSTRMADLYYESVGQNWERMVWIKGRPTAGDRESAARFLKILSPFVWRRNLDYWAIGDIQAIKRMINSKVGRADFETVSPDVKLGPGGIREIEFFAQTQQLILGGRQPELRDNSTLGALAALTKAGVVEPDTADELNTAYLALRNLEHRVQMRRDEQTHIVPAGEDDRRDVALMCGYDDLAAFALDLQATRRCVQAHYDRLFAHEDRALEDHSLGNLVFTGVDDDPGTIETLASLGFSNPSAAIDTIRNWHRGRVPATRTARGRELLTALLPGMLAAMGKTGEADEAFRWFSRFFEGLSSGVQTLSMLLAEQTLLDDLVSTLALAPRLAQILSRRPDLLEALVSNQEPSRPVIDEHVSFDGALDSWRRYHREQNFLIGHRLLHGLIQARDAGTHWSDLADDTIREMAAAAERETANRYGPRPGSWAVFAMGKLGGRELTAGSDLDLIVIYDADPMEAQTWYTRFTQRLITALTAPTAEGDLYEVDMRLRPSGGAGPVAVSVPAFERYQNKDAWSWEHMALTRLRPVAGDEALSHQIMTIACEAIVSRAAMDDGTIARDVSDMRQRLYREKPGKGLWDLKTAEGGLVDAEFVVQQDMLLSGKPEAIRANTREAIAHSTLPDAERSMLIEGVTFLQSLQQVHRLALGSDVQAGVMPEGLKDRLCRSVGVDSFAALEAEISSLKSRVHALCAEKLHLPATD